MVNKIKNGKSFLVVGAQGRGKSKFVIDLFKHFSGRDTYVFDPMGAYLKGTGIVNKAKAAKTRNEFLKIANGKEQINTGFPDASGFFGKGDLPGELVQNVSTVFHTGRINAYEFHDLTSFSIQHLIYINFIILFRTEGDSKNVLKKFSGYNNIIEAYKYVQEKTAGTAKNRATGEFVPWYYKNEAGEKVEVSAEYSRKWFHHYEVIKIQ